ncbi:MAG: AAA family ATPase [Chloroflexi bacterium]|nr:AAA family ATPase [Chloroflexota bacterium]
MPRVGKSSVVTELTARGYKAIDADCDEFSEWVSVTEYAEPAWSSVEADRDLVWRENRIEELLASVNADLLFVSGCAANMGRYFPRFNHIVRLSAPPHVIVERLAARTNNAYGKQPEQVACVLVLMETVEPLLPRAVGHEIDTSALLDDVVAALLRLVEPDA